MKKVALSLMACLFILAGCSSDNEEDDIIFDFINYSIHILVTDASGNNLLDPKNDANILDEKIKVIYGDKTFERLEPGQPNTRYNMPKPLALRTSSVQYANAPSTQILLAFGEFSPTSNYHDASFKIQWEDGSEDTIKFDLYTVWKSKNDPVVHSKYYLNGKEWTASTPITIVRQKVR